MRRGLLLALCLISLALGCTQADTPPPDDPSAIPPGRGAAAGGRAPAPLGAEGATPGAAGAAAAGAPAGGIPVAP